MKIVFHTHLATDFASGVSAFASRYPDVRFVTAAGREQLFTEITDADVLVDHRVTPELLDAALRLKWLFVPFTGLNAVPWEILEDRGIRVSNNHGNAAIVAERALALALAVAGRVVEFDRGLRTGYWFRNESREEPFVFWSSLAGKRVSILGIGAIGRNIARLIGPLAGEILGFHRNSGRPAVEGFSSTTTDLRNALDFADLCFVTLPLTPETEGLLGEAELARLKNSFLVNVSRGEVIREKPLFHALESGILAGAALDVWYRYPEPFHSNTLPSELPFHELDNLVLSPHAGSHTAEGKEGQLEGVFRNLVALIETGLPIDIANSQDGY